MLVNIFNLSFVNALHLPVVGASLDQVKEWAKNLLIAYLGQITHVDIQREPLFVCLVVNQVLP